VIQKKICLLGASAVGKTSLVARFVRSLFNERYLTTVGVKIDQKPVTTPHGDVNLVIWDLNGEDQFQPVQTSYLRGLSGYLLVADGTRRATLETALDLHRRVIENFGARPNVLVLNKADLQAEWDLDADTEAGLLESGFTILRTSAKLGAGVEDAFSGLAARMLEG
jgi:small GTP-binding protein